MNTEIGNYSWPLGWTKYGLDVVPDSKMALYKPLVWDGFRWVDVQQDEGRDIFNAIADHIRPRSDPAAESVAKKPLRSFRPKRLMYLAVASILDNDRYLELSMSEFVSIVMKSSHGTADPHDIADLYIDLILEARGDSDH